MFNKLLKELKENKYTTIVFFIFLGLFIIAWFAYGMIMPSSGSPVYGNRLDGIEKVELTDNDINKIKSDLKNDIVSSSTIHVSGKIINILVEVKEGTKINDAKKIASNAIKSLDKDELAFYDVQVFITNEEKEAKGYPIIGYKSSSAKKFVF